MLSALPIYRREVQSPPIHFLAKFVGVLLHAFTDKPVSTAQLHIQMNLLSDIFIKRQKAFIPTLWEIHFHAPTTKAEIFLQNKWERSSARLCRQPDGNQTADIGIIGLEGFGHVHKFHPGWCRWRSLSHRR
jgi:hypothetical protein